MDLNNRRTLDDKTFRESLARTSNPKFVSLIIVQRIDKLVRKLRRITYEELNSKSPEIISLLMQFDVYYRSNNIPKIVDFTEIDAFRLHTIVKFKVLIDKFFHNNSSPTDDKKWALRTLSLMFENTDSNIGLFYNTEMFHNEDNLKLFAVALYLLYEEHRNAIFIDDIESDIELISKKINLEYSENNVKKIYQFKYDSYQLINRNCQSFDDVLDFFFDHPYNVNAIVASLDDMENELSLFNTENYEGNFYSENEIRSFYFEDMISLDDYDSYKDLCGNSMVEEWLNTNFTND